MLDAKEETPTICLTKGPGSLSSKKTLLCSLQEIRILLQRVDLMLQSAPIYSQNPLSSHVAGHEGGVGWGLGGIKSTPDMLPEFLDLAFHCRRLDQGSTHRGIHALASWLSGWSVLPYTKRLWVPFLIRQVSRFWVLSQLRTCTGSNWLIFLSLSLWNQ